jgi:CCR4-NOT transcriptional regulation complex NOT5 subunit
MGKPEPGVDVFAEKPVNDAKSSGNVEGVVKDDQDTRKVEKEVSSVAPEAQTTIDAAAAEPKKEEAETSSVSSSSSSTTESSSTVSEEKKVPEEKEGKKEPEDVPAVAPKDPAGPLEEMDMEAKKVAEELYPEAAGA